MLPLISLYTCLLLGHAIMGGLSRKNRRVLDQGGHQEVAPAMARGIEHQRVHAVPPSLTALLPLHSNQTLLLRPRQTGTQAAQSAQNETIAAVAWKHSGD